MEMDLLGLDGSFQAWDLSPGRHPRGSRNTKMLPMALQIRMSFLCLMQRTWRLDSSSTHLETRSRTHLAMLSLTILSRVGLLSGGILRRSNRCLCALNDGQTPLIRRM